jgi:pimeloyl-ACP methyl ester carboxylesterase
VRAAASPRMARALIETALEKIDVRDVLSSVHVPTLVLHVEGDRPLPIEAGQLLADGIPGARFVAFPGVDHAFWWGPSNTTEAIVEEIERFVVNCQ